MQAAFRTAVLMPWQQGVDCYFLQTHQHNLLLILLQRLRAAITEAAPATRGVICYLDCKNSGYKTNCAHFINGMCHPLGLQASLHPIKHRGGMHEILTPNYGAAFVYGARVSTTNARAGGAGVPAGSPPFPEPPPFLNPSHREGVVEPAAEKQAGRRVAPGLDGRAFNAWFHHFLASDWTSDFLFLSLSLLICIMGSTTLPASSCEGAVSCQCQAVSTEGEVRGLGRPFEAWNEPLQEQCAEAAHTDQRQSCSGWNSEPSPPRPVGALEPEGKRPCQHLRHWIWRPGHDLNLGSATHWLCNLGQV